MVASVYQVKHKFVGADAQSGENLLLFFIFDIYVRFFRIVKFRLAEGKQF